MQLNTVAVLLLLSFQQVDLCAFDWTGTPQSPACFRACLDHTSSQQCSADECVALCGLPNDTIAFNSSDYSATIAENATLGTPVLETSLRLPASWTTNATVVVAYSIVDTITSPFNITNDGILTVGNDLDRERQGVYFVVMQTCAWEVWGVAIRVDDASTSLFCATAQVVVIVEDRNDNAPLFSLAVYETYLLVDESVGVVVVRPSVRDDDVDSANRNVTFTSTLNATTVPFSLDPISGFVLLSRSLRDIDVNTRFDFRLQATDGVHVSTADAIVHVVSERGSCAQNPCAYGRCSPTPGDEADCVCDENHSGVLCEDPAVCFSGTCGTDVNRQGAGRCIDDGQSLIGCLYPSNTDLTGMYQLDSPYTSVTYPQLNVDNVAKPELCYSTLQLVAPDSPAAFVPLLADVNVTFDRGSVFVTLVEEKQRRLNVFVQVCCPDFDCFTLTDDNGRNRIFSIIDDIRLSVIPCPLIYTVLHGSYSCTGFAYGDTCSFECDLGYESLYPEPIRCGDDGKWTNRLTGNPTVCDPVDCPILSYDNTTIECNATHYLGVCNVTCTPGLLLGGSLPEPRIQFELNCNPYGLWEGIVYECNRTVDCGNASVPNNGSVSCSGSAYLDVYRNKIRSSEFINTVRVGLRV